MKQEDLQIQKLEKELREMEARLKEKKQENNLLDFKLRDMARVNDSEVKFIRPNAGVHKGLLNNNLNLPLAQTLFMQNKGRNQGAAAQSMDIKKLREEMKSQRSGTSRYSSNSRALMRLFEKEAPIQTKPRVETLQDTSFDLGHGSVESSLQTPVRVKSKPLGRVNLSQNFNKVPSHLRGANFYIRKGVGQSKANARPNLNRSTLAPINKIQKTKL